MEKQCSLKNIYGSHPQPVCMFGSDGKISWLNPAATTNRTDIRPEMNLLALEHPEFSSSIQQAFHGKSSLYSGPDPFDIMLNNPEIRNTEIFILPYFPGDKPDSFIMIFQEKEESRNPQPEACPEEAINTYLRYISHEIRTPLNWIIGFSNLIDEEDDIDKIKEYNNNISRGGNVILSSFEQLIDMSGMIKNEVRIDKTCFSVSNFLQEIKTLLEHEVKELELGVEIRLNLSFNNLFIEKYILSDRNKLRQIFIHLLHNALKYTRSGYIEIGCREMPESMLLFYVEDSGIGICSEIQHHIREIFSRNPKDDLSSLTGQALGLSITNNYVKLLKGNIWVESESEKGTTFFFTIKDLTVGKEEGSGWFKPAAKKGNAKLLRGWRVLNLIGNLRKTKMPGKSTKKCRPSLMDAAEIS